MGAGRGCGMCCPELRPGCECCVPSGVPATACVRTWFSSCFFERKLFMILIFAYYNLLHLMRHARYSSCWRKLSVSSSVLALVLICFHLIQYHNHRHLWILPPNVLQSSSDFPPSSPGSPSPPFILASPPRPAAFRHTPDVATCRVSTLSPPPSLF